MNETMSDNRPWMSDLEKELADDTDGRMLRERKNLFQEYSHNISRTMENGMGMDELHRAMDMKQAAESAITVLEHLWRRIRTGGS